MEEKIDVLDNLLGRIMRLEQRVDALARGLGKEIVKREERTGIAECPYEDFYVAVDIDHIGR